MHPCSNNLAVKPLDSLRINCQSSGSYGCGLCCLILCQPKFFLVQPVNLSWDVEHWLCKLVNIACWHHFFYNCLTHKNEEEKEGREEILSFVCSFPKQYDIENRWTKFICYRTLFCQVSHFNKMIEQTCLSVTFSMIHQQMLFCKINIYLYWGRRGRSMHDKMRWVNRTR